MKIKIILSIFIFCFTIYFIKAQKQTNLYVTCYTTKTYNVLKQSASHFYKVLQDAHLFFNDC